jgi:uncharacterized protein YihD (DUF1040 family)
MITDEMISELKAKHGVDELRLLEACGESVLIRKPNRGEYQRFRAKLAAEATRDSALEQLVRTVIVYPPPPDFSAMLERLPGLAETFGDEVLELVGVTKKLEAKKV